MITLSLVFFILFVVCGVVATVRGIVAKEFQNSSFWWWEMIFLFLLYVSSGAVNLTA